MDTVPFHVGSFGKVYRGTWLGSPVVVKCVDVQSNEARSAVLREAAIWKRLHDRHIVPFYGACLKPGENSDDPSFLVCEEAANGSLRNFLFNEKQAGRSPVWRTLRDAALGLHFLHQKGIVHGDLKGNQILVNEAGVAMLTDFGMSSIPARTVAPRHHEAVGAFQWKAPELLGPDGSAPTIESDVYAFGMCVVEALCGGPPWGDFPDVAIKFSLLKIKESAARSGLQRTISTRIMPRPVQITNEKHWAFVRQLCAFEPSKRLKLPEAIEILEQFAQEEIAQECRHSQQSSEAAQSFAEYLQL
ncbi:hypothetical protein BBJ28_00000224 [Nothophytophthora sp. Chile5]|nr:hypothetical protein BBJ28_00000224 [Nothophytophthora sp. Chile5]